VYEQVLGEYHYTIVEEVKNPQSCTILMKGPNPHTIAQLKDAVRGVRACGVRACSSRILIISLKYYKDDYEYRSLSLPNIVQHDEIHTRLEHRYEMELVQ